MKRILLLFAGISITLMLNAQVSKTVNVTVGGLFSALNSTELSTVTNLIITGTIDARDFKTMRDNMPALTDIDISGTNIAAYSGSDGTYNYNYNFLGNWIPDYAFLNSSSFIAKTSLKSILLPSSITSIGKYAFRGCTGLLSVTIPALVTTIGEYAFYGSTGLTSVIFSTPSSVSIIGNNAFQGCTKLSSIDIPTSVTALGSSAFQGCIGLTSVNFSTPSSLTTIGSSSFQGNTGLSSVTIPASVTSIGGSAFRNCSNLISVNFSSPSSVTTIGGSAFSSCSKLTSIDIPTSVTSIGNDAFSSCSSLISVNFTEPSSITTLGDNTFQNCTKLASIDIPTLVTSIGEETFRNCYGLTSVNFSTPSSVNTIKYNAFNACTKLASVTIPGSVTTIQDYAFVSCISLTTLNFSIPSLLNTIQRSAFRYCSKLTSVTIPASVTNIGSEVFQECSGLTEVIFSTPSSLTTIETGAFAYCTGLTSFAIPTSVTTIERSVFFGCTGLTSVTIPSSVTSIGRDVFYNCSGLLSVNTQKPVPVDLSSSSNVFYGVNKVTCTLYVPYQSKALYAAANQWMDFTNITEMPGFKLSATALNVESDESSTASLNIISDVTWTATSNQGWLSANPLSGTGSNTVTITALANASFSPRTAIITISAMGVASQTITVTQPGAIKVIDVAAGGLFSALTVLELSTITRLVLTGTIDARDFKTMRDNMPLLAEIDISGATIATYSGTDGTFTGINFIYPENVIPNYSFYSPGTGISKTILKSIIFPSSITSVWPYAFYGCSGLTSVTIPSSVTAIWEYAFSNCVGLTSVNFSTPSSLITLKNNAFGYCTGLISLNIPESVTTIGNDAFYYCTGLSSVTIPSSVTSIGIGVFSMCSGLTSITTEIIIPVDLSSSPFVFYNVNKVTCTLYVPYQTKPLYAAANQWKDFTNITEMPGFNLSATAFTLATEAGSAASANINSDVTWTASSNQDWLTASPLTGSGTNTLTLTAQGNTSVATRIAVVTISATGVPSQTITITQIGVPKTVDVTAGGLLSALTVFERNSITRLVITGTIDARDFKTMRDSILLLAELDISGATIAAYSGMEGTYYDGFNYSYPENSVPYFSFHNYNLGISKTSLNSVLLPSSVTGIGERAFWACTGLISVNFSTLSSLTTIEYGAFYFCTGLTSVTIPTLVTSIGDNAFERCGITSLNFSTPSSLTIIGYSVFKGCAGITSVTIPTSVTTISTYAFQDCTGLTTVTIPVSVTTIQSVAFLSCSGLTSIIAENPVPVDLSSFTGVFAGVNKTTCKLYVPYEAKVLYAAADQWKDFLNITEMAFRFSTTSATVAASEGSTVAIDIATSIAWSASSDQAWLAVSPSSGTGNNTITFTAQANPQNKSRFATITVSAPGVDSQTIIITQQANDMNNVPVANAGPDQTVDVGVKVTLDGSASTDADGNQLTYKWTSPSGITLNSSTVAKPEFTAPVVASNTTYIFSLVVNDGTIDSPADTVVVTVRKPNTAPVANAGSDQSVNEGVSVSLDGSASSDPDGNPLTYLWTAPSGITLSSTTAGKPTFTAPEVSTDTQYTFSLVVNDGSLNSPADQITVTVKQVNKVPVANAGADRSVDEGEVVTLDGSASTDADGNALTYKWTAPAGITLNSATVAKPVFTAPEVAVNTNYTFTLVVNDGTADSPADQVVITVRQLNVAPVANAGADQTVDAGVVVTLNGSASTDADGNTLTYQWTAPAGITLNSTTVVKPEFTAPGVTSNTSYTFSLVVNDGLINSNTAYVNVNIIAPIILSSEAQIVTASGPGIASSQVEQSSSQVILITTIGADPRALAPTFQISPKATINPASGSIHDFSSPVNYTVTAENGKVTKTYSVKVKSLPDILVKDIQAGAANINPGDSLTINWKVENIAGVSAIGGWVERISLVPVSGLKLLINPGFEYKPDLAAGATINRSKKIKLPELLRFSGDVNIEVELIPFPALQEYLANKANNKAISAGQITVGNLLYLDIQTTSVLENSTSPVRCIITRSGDYSADLQVSLLASVAGQVTIPASVTIPANQSSFVFNLNTINNIIIDGPRNVAITASAADYTNTQKNITIIDDEIPGLTAQLSKTSATEGETITLTVTRDLVTTAPLTVNLSTTKISQWTFPSSLIIPANSASGSVTVSITDDNIPEITSDATIYASSAGFTTGQVTASIIDNDIPQVSLELLTDTVSETAGIYATWGIIRRIKGDDIVTVNLSSNLPNAIIFPASISLPKGVLEQKFNIGVVDNSIVDGYRKVTISGSILIASCNCGTTPENGGVVKANLVIADNDGPALSVSINPISLPEGKQNAGTLTISRNTPTTDALVVTITHNDTTEVSIQATATIPAGEKTVQVPIHTKNDNIEDGNQMVSVQASAVGFTTGFGYVFVTDLNKPDLEITDIQINADTVLTNGVIEITGTAFNSGFATAPSGVKINFYLSKDKAIDTKDILLGEFAFPSPIAIRSAANFVSTVNVPNETGNFFVLAKINPSETVTELIYFNNVSDAVAFNIIPSYTATAAVENLLYLPNTTIPIQGSAFNLNNQKVPNVDVDVYILSNGTRREIKAKTDNSGNYSIDFVPIPNESGHFTIGASFPKQNISETQDLFDIPGIQRVSNSNIIWELKLDETIAGKIAVRNTSEASLNKLVITADKLPAGCQLVFDTIAVLAGNQSKEFSFTLKATGLTSGRDYEKINFQIKSSEGITADFPAWYYCQAAQGQLKAYPENLITTVTKGKSRLYELAIYNNGAGETGKVTISLPNVGWMKLVSPDTIANIAAHDTAKVILTIEPDSDIPLNTPVSGNIAMNCTNGIGLQIPYKFEVVSEETGGLLVDVIDEYTYFTEAKPHVKNAHVVLRNLFSGQIVAEGFTGENGIFYVDNLPEGPYQMIVEADKHEGFRNNITIDPGRVNEQSVFLSFQAITYTWEVVPTQIEDKYEVQLVMQYETNVPVPVVIVEMPDTLPQLFNDETYPFLVTLTNKGLITAEDVDIILPQTDPEYEFVTNFTKLDLLAQQSIQVPVVMKRRAMLKSANVIQDTPSTGPCTDYTHTVYGWTCGKDKKWGNSENSFTYSGRRCSGEVDSQPVVPGSGINPGPPVYGGTGGTGFYFNPNNNASPNYISSIIGCDNCWLDLAIAIGGCVPVVGAAFSAISCVKSAYAGMGIKEIADCIIGFIPGYGCAWSLANVAYTCYGDPPIFSSRIETPSLKSSKISKMPPILKEGMKDIEYFIYRHEAEVDWMNEFMGSMDWKSKDSFLDFVALLDSFTVNKKAIDLTYASLIKGKMLNTDITDDEIDTFVTRWNNSLIAWNLGIFSPTVNHPGIIDNNLLLNCVEKTESAQIYAVSKGFGSVGELYNEALKTIKEQIESGRNSVCSSVTINITQKVVMTREAFEGTLTIFNGNTTTAMREIKLNLEIRDEKGVLSNDLFQIETKALSILTGIDGTGTLGANVKGSATVLFIPEKGAAPEVPKNYSFGGSFSYVDPFTDVTVTRPLFPVTLSVNPSPDLFLHYFMQRNILGDDALTPDVIEPIVPAEFAVLIQNNGFGTASNVRIAAVQPKITDNEKGLAINFALIGSNLNGQPRQLGLINIDFGNIAPKKTTIGQWWFTSSLLGHFVSYDAKVTHLDSRGNPNLSLISGATMHELIRSVRVYSGVEDGINDFLVNEVQDSKEFPDVIYLSNGGIVDVHPAVSQSASGLIPSGNPEIELVVTPDKIGWNYIKFDDPGDGKYKIVSVTREDGQVIPLDNVWQTHVTLPDGKEPVYENMIHFLDGFAANAPQKYIIRFKAIDQDPPEILKFENVPASFATSPVTSVNVIFKNPVDPATFNYEDMVLRIQGGADVMDNTVTVTQLDPVTYKIDLTTKSIENGFYALTVQASQIKNLTGTNGLVGKQATWTQMVNIPAVKEFIGLPDNNIGVPFDLLQLRFNLPIDLSTLLPGRFTWSKDGAPVSGAITVTPMDTVGMLFQISGFQALISQEGKYSLTVDLPNIKTQSGVPGILTQSVNWEIDKTAPKVSQIIPSTDGGYDSQHLSAFTVKFNEPVKGFTVNSLELWKDGLRQPLSQLNLTKMTDSEYQFTQFRLLTYYEGTYQLKVKMEGITDNAGNSSTDTVKYDWIVYRTAPLAITNLRIAPDMGFSDFDGITATKNLLVKMTVNQANSRIQIYQTDNVNPILLADSVNVNTGPLSLPVTFSYTGNVTLEAHCIDLNNNKTVTKISVFIDEAALVGAWKNAPLAAVKLQPLSLQIEFSDKLLDDTKLKETLKFERDGQSLGTQNLSITKSTEKIYSVSGMDLAGNIAGTYSLSLDVSKLQKYTSGKQGALTSKVQWSNINTNNAPVANAGSNQSVVEGATVTLNGSASSDPDGNVLTYLWTAPAGITLSSTTAAKPTFTAAEVNSDTQYTFTLVVSDGSLSSGTASVLVTVKQLNKAPSANSGPDQNVDEGTLVTLDGTGSSDPDSNTLTYLWSAPSGITLSSTSAAKPTFTAPEVNSDTQYNFTLVVSDGSLSSVSASVLVTVKQVNKAPSANAGPDQTVDEGTLVNLDGSASSDPDANTLTYLWTAPSGITLSSTSAAKPTFTAPEVNSDTQYTFTLVVSDGSLSSGTASVLVTVKQLNKAPSANSGPDQNVDEGTLVTLDGTGSSDPDSNTLTYLWSAPSGITLSSTSAAKPTFTAPEVNSDTQYTFSLVVSDGSLSSAPASVLVTVKKVNKSPSANAGPDQTVDEGTLVNLDGAASSDPDGNTLTYLWTAPSGITLSSTTAAKPTFTAPEVNSDTQYNFTLVVSDGSLSSGPASVLVTVKQVNKSPLANAGLDQTVDEGATVTLDGSASSDPDGNTFTYRWTAPTGITLSSTSAAIPTFTAPEVNSDTQYTFSLVVSDGSLSSVPVSMLVTVKQVNKAPSANAGPDQTVDEGTLVTLDGTTSSDPDGNTLTYLWTAPSGITLSSTSAAKPIFMAPEVKEDTFFVFSLIVNNGIFNSEASVVKILVKNVINTTSEFSGLDDIKIYPNPSKGIFNIEGLNASKPNIIEIYTIDGKLIKQKKSNSIKEMIDISDQISGIYLLLIDKKTFKILKQ
jgi:ACT domain-containing protein